MTVRAPVLISTVTAIPGVKLTRLSSICIWVRSREMRAAYQLLALGFARAALGAWGFVACFVLGLVTYDRILRHTHDFAAQKPVSREIEGVDLDFRILPGMYKANVAVRHHRLDLETALGGHYHQQGLGGRDDAPDGVDGELLNHAVNRRDKALQLGALLGLHEVLAEACHLTFSLHQVAR